MTASAKTAGDYPVFRIKASDSNKFALVADPHADGTSFVAVVEIFDVGGATPPNAHAAADELFFVLHGEGVAVCDGRRLPIRAGDSFLVRAGAEHVVENTGATRLYCLTTMVPDEEFAALIRNGVPDRLDEADLAVLGGGFGAARIGWPTARPEAEDGSPRRGGGAMLHGWIPPARFLPYLTTAELAALQRKAETVVLQPVAAIEQHGPHLPLAVDTAIVCGVLGRALERLDPAVPALCLPPLCYGKSNEHSGFPGTITLSAGTLLATLGEVCDSLYASGFRKIALVNGHGGQPQVVEIAARDAHARHRDLQVFPLFVWRVPHCAAELFPAQENELGIHAGAAETALMLALAPELVHMDRAVAEYPRGLPQASLLSLEGKRPFAWLAHEVSASGVLGDPTLATPDKGERLLESLAASWAQLIADLHRFRQPPG